MRSSVSVDKFGKTLIGKTLLICDTVFTHGWVQVQRLRQIVRERVEEATRERQQRDWERSVAHGMEGALADQNDSTLTSSYDLFVCVSFDSGSPEGNRPSVSRVSGLAPPVRRAGGGGAGSQGNGSSSN